MAHLWQLKNEIWEPAMLAGAAAALAATGELRPAETGGLTPVRLLAAGPHEWILLAPPAARVRVNGRPVVAGIRALRDRDEIVFAGSRYYYSTERLARVEPCPVSDVAMFCVRCRQRIEHEEPAVRCPGCGSWHHQRTDLGCWLYAPTCQLCDQSTALDAGYRWEPEA